MIKKYTSLFVLILILSCKEPIPDPEQAVLINPENNNACLFSNSNTSFADVEFSWTESKYTDNYDLLIQNKITNENKLKTTNLTTSQVTLERGVPYSWYVISKSDSSENIALSEIRNFYLEAESQLAHIPFPAKLIYPLNGSILNSVNIVSFQWEGYDLDGDIESYDLIIENASNGEEIKYEKILIQALDIELQKGNVYLWKIITRDKENNISTSVTSNFESAN